MGSSVQPRDQAVRLPDAYRYGGLKRTLTQLRVTLLPRLISGPPRLPESETMLEKAL